MFRQVNVIIYLFQNDNLFYICCRNCCSPLRGSLQNVLRNRFLPPPVSLSQTSHGLAASAKDETLHFPSMFVLNSLHNENILPKSANAYKLIPYDLYCTSVKSVLSDRICGSCGIYFASAVMLREHRKSHKTILTSQAAAKKTRPVRVAAKRQREWMAIISRGGNMDCEWIEEDELDLSDLPQSPPLTSDTTAEPSDYLVVSINDHLQNPWIEE